MCGLVGVISRVQGGLYGYDLDVFEEALVIDTLRGKDSTGAFFASRNTTATAIKHGSVPHELFKTKQWNTFRGDAVAGGRFIIGHNRAATRGEVNTDNAHPFVEGKIVLVHNGTLQNEKELTDKQVVVDSNAVAHAFNESEDIADTLSRIRGAYAFIWYNTETKKLHAIRNKERPLHLITCADRFMLASEAWMMACPWQRKAATSKIDTVEEIEPGDLYTWDLDGKMTVKTLDLSPKVHSRPDTGPPTTTTGTKNNDGHATGGTDPVVFPKGSQDKAGQATPEAGILRQAMESVPRTTLTTKKGTQPSNVCALTRSGDTDTKTSMSTTENDSTKTSTNTSESSNLIDAEGRLLTREYVSSMTNEPKPIDSQIGLTLRCSPTVEDREMKAVAKNVVELPHFRESRKVLIKVLDELHPYKNRPRFVGHLMEPGMEMVSVRGFMPEGVAKGDWCTGAIYFTSISVHGPEVHVTNVTKSKETHCHGRRKIPEHLWTLAYLECACDGCNRILQPHEKAFTSVVRKSLFNVTRSGIALNVMEILCPDCVEQRLPEGEYLESFKYRRRNMEEAVAHARAKQKAKEAANAASYLAVQERQSGGFGTRSESSPLILLPGSSSVH